MTNTRFMTLIAITIMIHFVLMGLFAFEYIPQQTKRDDASIFYFHHGGDNYEYYSQTKALARGEIELSRLPIGYSLLLVPAYFLFGQPTHDMMVQPIALFSSLIMFPMGILIFAWIAYKVTQSYLQSFFAVLLFVLLPLIYLIVFNLIWNPFMAEVIAIHATWAQMLTDGPTAFISLVIVALFIYADERDYPLQLIIIIGLLLGFLGTIRLTGILVGTGLYLVLLLNKRWMQFIVMGVTTIIGALPQLIYNTWFFANPFKTGYNEFDTEQTYGLFHPAYLLDALNLIWQDLGIVLIFVIVLLLLAIAIGLYRLSKMPRHYGVIIGCWLFAYVIFYSLYAHSWKGAMMRFMIPVEAPACLFAVIILWQLKDWLTGFKRNPSPTPESDSPQTDSPQ